MICGEGERASCGEQRPARRGVVGVGWLVREIDDSSHAADRSPAVAPRSPPIHHPIDSQRSCVAHWIVVSDMSPRRR